MAKLQNVLVSYDGSPHSKEALHWAIYFGRHSGANITAVKVFEPFLTRPLKEAGSILPDSLDQYEQLEKQDQQLMAEAKAWAGSTDYKSLRRFSKERLPNPS